MEAKEKPSVARDHPDAAVAAVLEGYPGPVLHFGADGQPRRVNRAASLVQTDIKGWQLILQQLAQAFRGGDRVWRQNISIGADRRTFEWSVVPLADGGGTMLFGRDLTLDFRFSETLAESRQRYKDLVDISADFAWETDADGHFAFVSPRGALGFPAEALVGNSWSVLQPDADDGIVPPFMAREVVEDAEIWLEDAAGDHVLVRVTALPLRDAGGVWRGARGVCRDVTQARAREAEATRARTREKLARHLVRVFRDQDDPEDGLRLAAAATARALGAAGCALYRRDDHDRCSLAASTGEHPPAGESLPPPPPEFDSPVAVIDPARSLLLVHAPFRHAPNGTIALWRQAGAPPWSAEDGEVLKSVASHMGLSFAHATYQAELRRLSQQDALTGLANRAHFIGQTTRALAARSRGGSALLFLDLDNFKAVNDVHGHHQGDQVLMAIADILRETAGEHDLPARLGGDEFVLWLEDGAAAEQVAAAIIEKVGTLHHLAADAARPLGVSIGIARARAGAHLKKLIALGDEAMYEAKKAGKNQYAVKGA